MQDLLEKSDEQSAIELEKFRSQYPNISSGDLQAFAIGWQASTKFFLQKLSKNK